MQRPFLSTLMFATIFMPVLSYASSNGANDYLLSLSSKGQADMLGKVVGDGCKGKTPFYMGSAETSSSPLHGGEHDTFWSLRCKDGRSFVIEVYPNGNGKVLECAVLEALHGHCFKKF